MATKLDAEGRLLLTHQELRGSLVSSYVSLTTGTATQLIAGDVDYLLDIVEVTFAHNSFVATGTSTAQVSLVSDGTIIETVQVPVGETVQLSYENPLRQLTKNTPWFADMDDITGSTITVKATMMKKRA